MATITFKGKLETVEYVDGTLAYTGIKIPVLKKSHCDMQAFRIHAKYGHYANSDLFPAILKGIKKEIFGTSEILKMESIPEGVRVDTSGFLCKVSFDV